MLSLDFNHSSSPVAAPVEHRFDPYTDNGGTTLAIAGEDFCLVAGDTRMSQGYLINARYSPKVYALSNNVVFATGGMHADGVALNRAVQQRLEWYYHKHNKRMSAGATAQMLSTMLYGKRFFPYYVWSTLGGLDEDGKGAVYSYDPVGNYEKQFWNCSGSAGHLMQPFLDSQVGQHHQGEVRKQLPDLTRARKIALDAFTGAAERDIYTGDSVEIFVVTKEGVQVERHQLKKD
ncbi:nucleophile aminohydrolase [Zopfochytrium polystomum]|nr:nucleophile aminohydrolase [Zopfochytrium polystomum]